MAVAHRRRFFVLCFIGAASTILLIYQVKSWRTTVNLFSSPANFLMPQRWVRPGNGTVDISTKARTVEHNEDKTVQSESTPVFGEGNNTPVHLTKCPCSRDLQEVRNRTEEDGVAMEIETDEDMVVKIFQRHGLKARRLARRLLIPLDAEFEAPLFRYPPLTHAVCLPDHKRSKVFLLTRPAQLSVGSPVQFRIDLYNSCGQPRLTGGDDVRAWLKSQDGNSSVAAKIKDLANGSYVGDTVLPWPGVTLVRVSLTYAREFLRSSVELYHKLSCMRFNTGTMRSGTVHETVPCLPFSPIPGYAKACNFTVANGDRPWFCGHPVSPGLNCSHSITYDNLKYTTPLRIPPALQQYVEQLNRCCKEEIADLRLIPNDIKLKPYSKMDSSPRPLPPCSSLPIRDSWRSSSPHGWLRNGHWLSSTCTLPPLTRERVQRCMRNKTLLLFGDSNQRLLWMTIKRLLNCSKVPHDSWYSPHICKSEALQSTMIFTSHGLPFSPGTHGDINSSTNLPLPFALQFAHSHSYQSSQDPHDANVIIVLHYEMHLSVHVVQVYRTIVQAAYRTVQEYFKTHPRAKVLIRGPHVVFRGNDNHVNIGDKFADWYRRLWLQTFRGLEDRVWYLDMWDLTIASENLNNHPEPVITEIAKIVLGYMCK